MKAYLLSALLLVCCSLVHAQSCCCTGAGANYTILPNLNKHITGMRWTYSQYDYVTSSLNPELNGIKNYTNLHSVELFGRFNLPKRFQISAFIPVSFIRQHSAISDTRSAGLGDITLLAQYSIFDPLKCKGSKSKHQLRLGSGIKLPTGKYEKNRNNGYNTSIQLGTGSVDFIANAIYTYRYNAFGFNIRAGYKLNTVNKQAFRFGDKVDGAYTLFYIIKAGKMNLMPAVGVAYAHLFNNYSRRQPVYYSNSDIISSIISLEADIGHFAFNISVIPVLYNRVNKMAFQQRFTTEAGMYYIFQTTKNKTKS